MSLRDYVRILRTRWYVVVAALVVGVVLAALYVGTSTKKYTSKAQLFVSTPSGVDLTQIAQGGTFAQNQVKSYASVATSPNILAPVIEQLKLPYTLDQLSSEVSASAPLNTVLINLSVTDPDPQRATAVVNAVASRLAAYIATLETPNGTSTSPVKATVTQSAQKPGTKTSPKTTLDLALGLVIGLVVGIGVAIALETLDNRVGGHHDIEEVAHAPVVGLIGEDKLAKSKPLILLDDAFSQRAEAFRTLRTNVRYLGVDRLLRSLVVTGSVESEGKSLTAANLAIALAQSGERVVLIDADLRRPTINRLFGLPGGVGLTSVLVGSASADEALQVWRPDLPLAVLPAGPTPPNPSELLGSQRLIDLVHELQKTADIILFDSPPLLPVTDGALLARATDGALVVARARSTRVAQVHAACASVRAADAHVLGIVINRLPKRRGSYDNYYAYHTYGNYAPTAQTGTPTPPVPGDARAEPVAMQVEGSGADGGRSEAVNGREHPSRTDDHRRRSRQPRPAPKSGWLPGR